MTNITNWVLALHNRTRVDYLLIIFKSKLTDTCSTRVFVSPHAKDTILNVYKDSEEVFTFKLQSWILPGAGIKYDQVIPVITY